MDSEIKSPGAEYASWKAPETGNNPTVPNHEQILEGHGFEEVERVGWNRYREALTSMSYADLIDHQLAQIQQLEAQGSQDKGVPVWITEKFNTEALQRAHELSGWLTREYGQEKGGSFVAWQEGDKKVWVQGCNLNRETSVERPLTRIYFSVPTKNSPEAFREVWASLVDAGVMDKVDLALNLESFQQDSTQKSFENNTLVLYVYGKNPELMTKVSKAIKRAKESKPELWQIPPKDKARAKTSILKDLMIPLDDTTSFVEANTHASYHAGPRSYIVRELTGQFIKVDLPELARSIRQFSPQTPVEVNAYEQVPANIGRKRHMPALIQNPS